MLNLTNARNALEYNVLQMQISGQINGHPFSGGYPATCKDPGEIFTRQAANRSSFT